jgi:hypothetical protein
LRRDSPEDFVGIRRWSRLHLDFLRQFPRFAHDIPSHDTLNDIINAIDGASFTACFTDWMARLRVANAAGKTMSVPEAVAIDGKTSRPTRCAGPTIATVPGYAVNPTDGTSQHVRLRQGRKLDAVPASS